MARSNPPENHACTPATVRSTRSRMSHSNLRNNSTVDDGNLESASEYRVSAQRTSNRPGLSGTVRNAPDAILHTGDSNYQYDSKSYSPRHSLFYTAVCSVATGIGGSQWPRPVVAPVARRRRTKAAPRYDRKLPGRIRIGTVTRPRYAISHSEVRTWLRLFT